MRLQGRGNPVALRIDNPAEPRPDQAGRACRVNNISDAAELSDSGYELETDLVCFSPYHPSRLANVSGDHVYDWRKLAFVGQLEPNPALRNVPDEAGEW